MKNVRHHDLLSFPADSHSSIHKQRFPIASRLAALSGAAAACCRVRAAAFVLVLLLAAGWPSVSSAERNKFCTFATSWTEADCDFSEQKKESPTEPELGCESWPPPSPPTVRATIVNIGRDGPTAVRLHTEPGDSDVAGSGCAERNDLTLADNGGTTGCLHGACDGVEQWWAHSVLFPDDYVDPPESIPGDTWNWAVAADFHYTNPGAGQANFQINAWPVTAPASNPDWPTGLDFQVAWGGQPPTLLNPTKTYSSVPIGPVVKNVWYDFVYHVKWSCGTSGYFDAWVRKGNEPTYRRVLAYKGPTLYFDEVQGVCQGVYLKLANYHTPFGQASSLIHDRVVRGTTWQDVIVTSPAATLEGQYEENAASYFPNVTPPPATSTSWAQYGPQLGTFSGGAIFASSVRDETATFTFTGTSVVWMGVKCNICGIATVSIDGGAPTTVDTAGTNAEPNLTSEAVFTASGLAQGVSHTMVITVTDQTSSGGTYIAVDGFWVNPIASN